MVPVIRLQSHLDSNLSVIIKPKVKEPLKGVQVFFIILIFLLFSNISTLDAKEDPKLILIHLDAISTGYFLEEMEAGNLPNLKAYFGDQRIDYTITYFPSKTPTIISSLRFGDTLRDSQLPGWEWIMNTAEETTVRTTGTFLKMLLTKSRISRTNILYGLPVFHKLAGLSLQNTVYYLNDYNILEFYWYNVDTQGHFHGEEAYRSEMATFDYHFGRLTRRMDEDINIIIYSDHGITFGEGVEIGTEIEQVLGDEKHLYSYPTLFITNPDQIDVIANKLVEETSIDFTFFEKSENVVKGYHNESVMYFNYDPKERTFNYEFSGEDILGYGSVGYTGEYLSVDEWLNLTHHTDYPLAPINIFLHLKNEVSGDIITLLEKDKFVKTGYSSMGNHGGFTRQDMTVPLLLKGPNVDYLADKDYYWLPDLFRELPEINFNQSPPRERNYLGTRYDFRKSRMVSEISISPKYRVHYGMSVYNPNFNQLNHSDRIDFWGKGDLFRSYLTRFWAGGGVEYKNGDWNPFLMLNYDIHILKVVIQNSYATNRPFYVRVAFEAKPWLAIETVNFTSIGFRVDF